MNRLGHEQQARCRSNVGTITPCGLHVERNLKEVVRTKNKCQARRTRDILSAFARLFSHRNLKRSRFEARNDNPGLYLASGGREHARSGLYRQHVIFYAGAWEANDRIEIVRVTRGCFYELWNVVPVGIGNRMHTSSVFSACGHC